MWILYFTLFVVSIIVPLLVFQIQTTSERVDLLSVYHTDFIKGIGILLVILGHTMQYYCPEIVFFTPTGGIGVALFLICSGYGLNESAKKEKRHILYWYKRFISVLVPYWIFQILIFWLWHPFDLKGVILDLLLIKPQFGFGWYLSYLFFWYLVFYCVTYIKCINKYRIPLMVLISCGILIFCRSLVAEQAVSFVIGVLLSDIKQEFTRKISIRLGIVLFCAGVVVLVIKQIPDVRNSSELTLKIIQLNIKTLSACGIVILSYYLCKKLTIKYISFLGQISYELYLVHGVVLFFLGKGPMLMLIYLCLSVVFAWVFNTINRVVKKRALMAI